MTRSIELFDLPALYQSRNHSISLDHARNLTRGNPLGAIGMLAYLNPARHIYGAVNDESGISLFGGVIHTRGDTFGRLLYLAPVEEANSDAMPSLVEHLVVETGKWGLFHVTAEAEEGTDAYRVLRKSGFSVYAWQRMWNLSSLISASDSVNQWQPASSVNLHAMQSLHYQIVPALMHPIEQAPNSANGLICCAGDMRGFVKIFSGPYGVVLMPFIHPEATEVAEKLTSLLQAIPSRRNRPVYLCVRSYQAWLEPVLEDMGASASERQAVMVKHMAHLIKEEQLMKAMQPAGAATASRYSKVEQKK